MKSSCQSHREPTPASRLWQAADGAYGNGDNRDQVDRDRELVAEVVSVTITGLLIGDQTGAGELRNSSGRPSLMSLFDARDFVELIRSSEKVITGSLA
jgi:hypothetical protein